MKRTHTFIRICLLLAAFILPCAGCARPNAREALAGIAPRAPEGSPRLLAIYQPWFGQKDHIDVGYSCHDPSVLRQQIARAREMNISGFVVNWYGPRKEFEDQSYALLQQAAAQSAGFKVAAQYDEAVDHPGYDTDAVIVDLQYLFDRYIGPNAGPTRSAYLRYNGRPVVFIFPKESQTDWNRIRQVTKSWPDPPLLIYKDQNDRYPDAFDGYYAWVQPGRNGWARDGSNYGEDYLNYFYRNMQEHHPDKIAVGAVWPGFDDSRASWSRNRHIAYRCGKTFEDVLRIYRKYYGSQNASPYLLVETWNDYEEGTDVERSITHCGGSAAGNIATGAGGQ
jgi:glycosyl hydrolase family 99